MEMTRILAINPGSTSTKIAVYEIEKNILLKTLRHTKEDLSPFRKITDQFEFRKQIILKELEDAQIDIHSLHAVVGRGGLIKPVEGGVYEVNETLKKDLITGVMGEHASNLGGLIAYDIARGIPGLRAFIADPVVVDELQEVARIAGHPKFVRKSIFHALNQKAIARAYAKIKGRKYEELNLIVAHLGGGISVGAHCKGRVIDVNNALDGEGPFSPERSGTLPAGDLARLCYSGQYQLDEVLKMITGEGGLVAHLGTNSAYEVEMRAKQGEKQAILLQNSMAYQISKYIGSMVAVLKGQVDAILITGGIAHNQEICAYIKDLVSFISPVHIFPGEDEMYALAINALLVLRGELDCKIYQ